MSKRKHITKTQAKNKIKSLRKKINHHNYLYYVRNAPEISDQEYDNLFNELKKLEEKYPELKTPTSPTQKVGAPPQDDFQNVKHTIPMLSLSNAFQEKEIIDFDKRLKRILKNQKDIEYIAEPKFDGLAVELIYKNGVFIQGSTRGDGITGEDITKNLKTVSSIPLKLRNKELPLPSLIEVRGEIYINKKNFEKLNNRRKKNNQPAFANPRNVAAGSLRQLDPKITSKRPLNIFLYGIGNVKGRKFESQSEILSILPKWGLRVNKNIKICKNIHKTIYHYKKLDNMRESLPYEIDGMVIKVNNLKLQKKLGKISRSPRWAIAYKFQPLQTKTKIKKIIVQVGRTGTLTPVAIMKPVTISGITINRATLHNQNEIDKKDIRIGDTVVIQRAGDVIPEVVKSIKEKRTGKEKKYTLPDKCPICGAKVFKSEEEAAARCTNISCPAILKESIKHFCSKSAMDIEGMGNKIVEQLADESIIENVADIYEIKKEDLVPLERFADKSAQNLIDAIEKSKKTTLSKLIYALGIRHVGEHLAKVLARNFFNIEALQSVEKEDLLKINEIGPEVTESIVNFFDQKQNKKLINKLMKAGVRYKRKTKKSKKLADKTFVFTGSLKDFTRSKAEETVESLGGKASSSVSPNTDFVVVGQNPGSKYEKAKNLQIKILSEKEFRDLVQ